MTLRRSYVIASMNSTQCSACAGAVRPAEPVTYEAEGANLYEKQIKHFREILDTGKPDYFYTDRAVHVQELVDMLYAQN